MQTQSRTWRLVAGAALSLGCTTARIAEQGGNRVAWAPPGSTVLTAQDLSRYAQGGTLADALDKAGPSLFKTRGGGVLVSVDGSRPVDVAILGTIRASTVAEVRLVRASSSAIAPSAIGPNGEVVAGDVLYVITRKN